jgi:CheY-like chemotaxis protein
MTGAGATVLVVDDQASVRMALRLILETDGYRVEEAADGQAALRACHRGGLALIVTDLLMPDCDGLEFLRMLRRAQPAVPVIVVTGADTVPQAIAGHLGARHVFLKPLPILAFRQTVRAVLEAGPAPPTGPDRPGESVGLGEAL